MLNLNVLDLQKPCSCGKQHSISAKDILIEKEAVNKIPALVQKYDKKYPVIICDDNTFLALGKKIAQLLPQAHVIQLNSKHLHADEYAVAEVKKELSSNCDLLLAVGSGTIHDITRYIAYEKHIAFFSVPTAASVDGFVSTVAAMTWKGFKKSFTACAPICVIADSAIIANAPVRLTASGAADLFGKYTALADWRVAHFVTGEYICENICALEEKAIEMVLQHKEGLTTHDTMSHEYLMYGLLLSGFAMQMVGNSRPASGAEHHFSHIWEMGLLCNPPQAYHGEKVGVGLMLASKVYHQKMKQIISGRYTLSYHKEKIADVILETAENREVVREMEQENIPNPLEEIQISNLQNKQKEIVKIIEKVPQPEEIEKILHSLHAPTTLEELGIDSDLEGKSILLSPYVRNRLTFMRLLKLYHFE